MALNIDKKVYRNLQEQVSWLTTTVAEIIDVTNPVAIKEAIDKIDDFQDTLDDYDDTMAGYALTMQGYAGTMGGYATTMQGYALQVDTWTNNIAAAAVSAISGQNIAPNNISANGNITADSIIENMAGYSYVAPSVSADLTFETIYAGAVKNGNKLTLVVCAKITKLIDGTINTIGLGGFALPNSVSEKLIPVQTGQFSFLDNRILTLFKSQTSSVSAPAYTSKQYPSVRMSMYTLNTALEKDVPYIVRYECTFLLSENLAA